MQYLCIVGVGTCNLRAVCRLEAEREEDDDDDDDDQDQHQN